MKSVFVEMDMPDGGTDVIGVHPSIAREWSQPIPERDGVKADRPTCKILNDKEKKAYVDKFRKESEAKRLEAEGRARKQQRELIKDVVRELMASSQ